MSKTLQGHCTKLNKNKKNKKDRTPAVSSRVQTTAILLYCAVLYNQQSQLPNHCQTTTRKVQSSARDVTVSDDAFLTDNGRLFHARAEATGKARSQSIECLVDGTTSMPMNIKF